MVGIGRSWGNRNLLLVIAVTLLLGGLASALEATDPKIAALLEKLKDKDPEVQDAAVNELATCGPAAAPALLQLLKTDDWKLQNVAAVALSYMGADADAVVPDLVELIREDKSKPNRTATVCLMVLGRMGGSGVTALASLLDGSDEIVQRRALGVLSQLGPEAGAAMPAVARLAAASSCEPCRSLAIEFLGRMGCQGVPDLLPIAESGSGRARTAAISAIGAALRRCRGLKDSEDMAVHSGMKAAELAVVNEALGQQGLDLQTVNDALMGMLEDPDAEVCETAIRVLISLGTDKQRVTTKLLGILKEACDKAPHANESVSNADWTTSALKTLGTEAEPAILQALREWEGRARCSLMKALDQTSSPAAAHVVAEILAEVKERIDAASVRVNEIAANPDTSVVDEDGDKPGWIELYNAGNKPVALAGWGLTDDPQQPHKWLIPAITMEPHAFLVIVASGKDRAPVDGGKLHTNFVLDPAGGYLGLFDASATPRQMPGLEEGYEAVPQGSSYCYFDDDEETMSVALSTLERLGTNAREAVPLLLAVSTDEIGYVGSDALDALVAIAPGAPEVVAAVVRTALDAPVPEDNDNVDRTSRFARTRVSSLAPEDLHALTLLKPALSAPDPEIRRWAFDALDKGSPDEAVVPLLLATLQGPDTTLHCAAIAALGKRGPAARDAAPILLQVAQSGDQSKAGMAAIALVQIGEHFAEAAPVITSLFDAEHRPRGPAPNPDDYEPPVSPDVLFEALAKIGPKAQETIPALIKHAGDGMVGPTQLAKAVSGAGPEGVASVLTVLRDKDAEPRKRCIMAETVVNLDGASDKAIPALSDCVKDANRHVRACAIVGLGSLAEKADAAVPALVAASKEDSDWGNRQRAAMALSRIRPKEFQPPRDAEGWKMPSYPFSPHERGDGPLSVE